MRLFEKIKTRQKLNNNLTLYTLIDLDIVYIIIFTLLIVEYS